MGDLKGIHVFKADEVKTVTKPWGYEKWMATGKPDFPYAYKIIFVRAPHKTSLQFHKYKQETNYIHKGTAILHYSDEPIDVERYEAGGYSEEELNAIIRTIRTRPVHEGSLIHVLPGHIHRIEAKDDDLTMFEASSTELDDVFRMQDDTKRVDGRIESEHRGY